MELECGDCAKLFTFEKLKRHKMPVHSKKKCEVCNVDISAANFIRHKKSCKSIDPLLEIQCNICNKLFDQKRYLKAHMKTYETGIKEETFTCSVCGNVYTNNKCLKHHMKTKKTV